MAHHRTFPIINLTPNPDSIFADMSFPSKESHMVFFLILFSLFFKKIKISDDSKSFLKINFHQTNKKTSFTIEWERIEQNAGSKKWRLHWGILEGQT